jgi:hypothetical protein
MGLTQLSAQTTKPDEQTISRYFIYYSTWVPISCDLNDKVMVDLNVHQVMRIRDGDWSNWVWMKMRYTGTLTIESTGEVFKINVVETHDRPIQGLITMVWHINSKKGINLIFTSTWNYQTGDFSWDKVICN